MGLSGKSKKEFGPSEYFSLIAEMLYHSNYELTKDCVRLYIKAKYNHDCDDKKLNKALSKFDSAVDKNGETWYDLKRKQYSKFLDKKWVVRSSIKREEILDFGFKPIKDQIKIDLAAKMDKPTCTGSKKFEEYFSGYSVPSAAGFRNQFKMSKTPWGEIKHRATAELMAERLLDNNEQAMKIINDEVFKEIIPFSDDSGCKSYTRICAFALRVLAYNKYLNSGNNSEEYKSITVEDCLEIAKNHEIFKPHRDAAEEYDKSSYIDSLAQVMFESIFKVIRSSNYRSWQNLLWQNSLATDKACYDYWKLLISKNASLNKDDITLDEIVDWVIRTFKAWGIVINEYDYIKPADDDDDYISDTSNVTADTDDDY